jgi:hypothetical protein
LLLTLALLLLSANTDESTKNELPIFDSFPNDSQDDFFREILPQRNQSAEGKMITLKRWVLPGLLSLVPLGVFIRLFQRKRSLQGGVSRDGSERATAHGLCAALLATDRIKLD